ncbi:MAG: glycoside hydrolase family 5 protein [Candidatus Goldbacteria bacterium]|nr:glycoside hydrolase family 5 protein [Candidatus Goldiibacteriota bacterium]
MKNYIPERLCVSGKKIKTESDKEIILRGVSIADPQALNNYVRGRFLSLSRIMEIAVKQWNVNVIRLPVHPYGIDDQKGWIANPHDYLNNDLNAAIKKSIDLGIYLIIDLHLICDYDSDDTDKLVTSFWSNVATVYKDCSNVIFELFNEPLSPDNWDKWRDTASPWIESIRKICPDKIILAGGPRWCQNMSGAVKNPIPFENIIYSAHCYPYHLKNFERNWGDLIEKYPVFFTEWGYENPGKIPWQGTTDGFGMPFKNIIEKNKLSWCAWCFDSDWPPRIFNRKWEIPDDRQNYMGYFTREWLKENKK